MRTSKASEVDAPPDTTVIATGSETDVGETCGVSVMATLPGDVTGAAELLAEGDMVAELNAKLSSCSMTRGSAATLTRPLSEERS